MPDPFEFFEHPPDLTERRFHARKPVRAIAYIQLDESNGGIILNISESGFAVCAVASMMDDQLPHIRFQIPQSNAWIEASGNIVWRSGLNRLAGIQFSGLSEQARGQIREWCYAVSTPDNFLEASEEETAPTETPLEERVPGSAAMPILELSLPVVELPGIVPEPVPPILEPPASPVATFPASQPMNVESPESSALDDSSATASRSKRLEAVPEIAGEARAPTTRPSRASPRRERVISYPGGSDANIAAAGLPVGILAPREPRTAAIPRGTRYPGVLPRGLGGEPLTQAATPAWDRNRWILIGSLCAVLSAGAAWEARHGNVRPFFPGNKGAGSSDATNSIPGQSPSTPSGAVIVPNTKPAGAAPSAVTAQPQVSVGLPSATSGGSTSPQELSIPSPARNRAHEILGYVVLSPPVRRQSPPPVIGTSAESGTRVQNEPSAPYIGLPDGATFSAGISNNGAPLPAIIYSSSLGPAPPTINSQQARPGALIYHVAPTYPTSARTRHIEGTVTLLATISASGRVAHVQPLSGPPELLRAATEAVRRWRYTPARLDGQPVEIQLEISIEFRLP